MRQVLKRISAPILRKFFKSYLNRPTTYTYGDISIVVEKGVFHPKFFFSTRILLNFLKKQTLSGKRILELGAGSGMISFYCEQQGAIVTASDISQTVIKGLHANADKLQSSVEIVESDLFENLMDHQFDCIIINPPYYPENPQNESEKAWFCGAQFDYFHKLFSQLETRKEPGVVWMILSEDCKLDDIKSIAAKHDIVLELIETDKNWAEKNFIFQLKFLPAATQ